MNWPQLDFIAISAPVLAGQLVPPGGHHFLRWSQIPEHICCETRASQTALMATVIHLENNNKKKKRLLSTLLFFSPRSRFNQQTKSNKSPGHLVSSRFTAINTGSILELQGRFPQVNRRRRCTAFWFTPPEFLPWDYLVFKKTSVAVTLSASCACESSTCQILSCLRGTR